MHTTSTLTALFVTLFLVIQSLSAQPPKQNTVKVFPNPATDFISVEESSNTPVGFLSIFNLMGRNIREYNFQKDEQYYIGDLPKGIYLVYLQDKTRKTIATQRIEKR